MVDKLSKITDDNYLLEIVRQEILTKHLEVTALIQAIQQCSGPREVLDELNAEGRCKIAAVRKQIDKLETLAKESENDKLRTQLFKEVENNREQLASLLAMFRKANLTCIMAIDKANKDELFDSASETETLRHRQKKDKESLVKMSSNVTDQLLSISRHLAETTQRSADTLDSLVSSSSNVHRTQDELQNMGSVISQSGKLLSKYGRREFTDKILIFFGFAFFLACSFYVVQKRIF